MRQRAWAVALGVVVGLCACDRAPVRRLDEGTAAASKPPRLTMEALHATGGVPPGWRFTPPPGDAEAGRVLFVEYGCHSCHVVRGAQLPPVDRAADDVVEGPELTGMGSHHPAGYFAEAIVNPNAVLVDGPGYIGADGRSAMPDYPDITLEELADLVAYLQSLTEGGGAHQGHAQCEAHDTGRQAGNAPAADHALGHDHAHAAATTAGTAGTCALPTAAAYLVQVQTVTSDELRSIDAWFAGEGGRRLRQAEGVTAVSLYVSRSPAGRTLVTVLGFDDEARLHALARRLAEADPAGAYGGLAGEGKRLLYRSAALYEARGLGESAPAG